MKNYLHENKTEKVVGEPISVIIITRNRYEMLKECVSSLLRQTIPANEIIIVDDSLDNSTQQIASEASKYLVKVINIPRSGLSKARNVGIESTRGEIIAFIDDDAIADPRWLEELVKSYKEDIAGVRGKVVPLRPSKIFHDPVFISHYDLGEKPKSIRDVFGLGCNMSLRKITFKEVGLFDPEIRWGHDDYELTLRLMKAKKKLFYNPHAIVYHDYAKNLSHLMKKRFILGFRLAFVMFKHNLNITFRRLPYIFFFPLLILLPIFVIYAINWTAFIAAPLTSLVLLRLYLKNKRARKFHVAVIATFIEFIRDFGLLLGILWTVSKGLKADILGFMSG